MERKRRRSSVKKTIIPAQKNKQVVTFKRDIILDANLQFKRRSLRTSRVTAESAPPAINFTKRRHSIDQVFINRDRKYTRLPENFFPVSYDIFIFPKLDLFTFEGRVLICMEVRSWSTNVVLNSAGLEIESIHFYANVNEALGQRYSTVKPTHSVDFIASDETETLLVQLRQKKEPMSVISGMCALKIYFKGVIRDQMKGLHYSRYSDEHGVVYYNFLTKCEPCDARRVFPCFDEPLFQAKFSLSLMVPKNKTVLANMPEKSTQKGSVYKSVLFEETDLMSTNVFCFVIGDFVYQEGYVRGIRIRVYIPPILKGQGRFAMNIAIGAINFMTEYTSKPCGLSKLDLVAVQEMTIDCQSNWGLIVCREDTILIRDTQVSLETPKIIYQRVALMVSHAVAVQWFGNLVPMFWWSDVWLSIGLATFLQYAIVEVKYESFRVMTQFRNNVMETAMNVDMFGSSHPLSSDVENPPEVEETFNEICYDKGAAVVYMIWEFMGETEFKKALANSLRPQDFGCSLSTDMFTLIGTLKGQNMSKMMTNWINVSGFPLITLHQGPYQEKTYEARLTVSQERFQPDVDNLLPACPPWIVPYSMIASTSLTSSSHQSRVLSGRKFSFDIKASQADYFLLTGGYFRVRYPESMFKLITNGIKTLSIRATERVAILRDLFAMAISGYKSVADVLELLPYYSGDSDYNVWRAIDDTVNELDIYVDHFGDVVHAKFRLYVLQLYKDIEKKYGRAAFDKKNPSSNEFVKLFKRLFKCCAPVRNVRRQDHLESLFFTLVIKRLCTVGHPDTVAWAKTRFIAAANDDTVELHPDLYGAMCIGLVQWKSSETNLHLLFKQYRKARSLEAKELIVDGFSLFNSPFLIRKILQFAISDTVPISHTGLIMTKCALTNVGRKVTWYFFKEHQPYFSREYYNNEQLLKPFFRHVLSHFMTEERYDEVKNFFTEHPFEGLKMTIEQTLHSIRRNISWTRRDFNNIINFFANINLGNDIPNVQGVDEEESKALMDLHAHPSQPEFTDMTFDIDIGD